MTVWQWVVLLVLLPGLLVLAVLGLLWRMFKFSEAEIRVYDYVTRWREL